MQVLSSTASRLVSLPASLLALGLFTPVTSAQARASAGEASVRPLADAADFVADAESFVTDALERLAVVPGVGLAVVVGDEIVLARGFGLADVERKIPSDGDTLYYIASSTKSFTALAAALLHARKKVDLDSPLANHLHGVTLAETLRPAEVKLRDLLTHTSGIDNGPIAGRLANTGEHDPATLWRLLARSTPMHGAPLGTFEYTNVGYNILGMILDRELGRPWQDLLNDEIFKPAGMTRTTAYASRPRKEGWTVAPPYFGAPPEGLRRLYLEKQDNTMQSAGGLVSTAKDMGRWLELQLNDGRLDGRQVFDAAVVQATHARLVGARGGKPPFGWGGYGLGWFHGEFAGRPVLHHAGGFTGFRALVSFMPETRIGVAVTSNDESAGGTLVDALSAWVYEWWLDLPPENRRAEAEIDQLVEQLPEIQRRLAATLAKLSARTWQLSRPRADYTGTFVNDLLGTVVIALAGDELEVRAGNLHGIGTPFTDPETMRIELIPGSGSVVTFEPEAGPMERIRFDSSTYERVR